MEKHFSEDTAERERLIRRETKMKKKHDLFLNHILKSINEMLDDISNVYEEVTR